MSEFPSSFENELGKLRAAPLDEGFLDRMEACIDGSWTRLEPTEQAFENHLRNFTPAALTPNLRSRLEQILAETPFQADPRIVAFPGTPETTRRQPRRNHGLAIAAAVALMGACAAFLMPPAAKPQTAGSKRTPASATAPSPLNQTTPNATPNRLVPAGFNRDLSEASDQGVIWREDNQPHRVLRLVYNERVTQMDAAGRIYEVEQPRVEYIIVPAKVD